MSVRTLAIVGASLAGAKAAEAARSAGYDGRILLIGEETPPYERPPLSKAVLRGEADVATTEVHPERFYGDHGIDLIADRVVALDTVTRSVTLAAGDKIPFDTAVLATGSAPRRLDMAGAELDGVHYLRTAEDSIRLRDAIRRAERVAVIGTGWIGTEVAASARQMGADVVLVGPDSAPLQRVLGETIGAVFAQLHSDHGVQLQLGSRVRAVHGDKAVETVELADGRHLEADVVVAGIGVEPRLELATAAAGVRVDNGVVVDQHLQTSVPGIFAAGDVANAWHPRYRRYLRVEHWANALYQGATAGRNAAGGDETYDRLAYFYSDQFDLGMEYVGHAQPGDDVIVRGNLGSREFIAFWHREGVVTAAMNVNVWDVIDDLKELVLSERPIDVARLADRDVALGSLVA